MTNINYPIDSGLHKKARIKALEMDLTLKEFIMDAIEEKTNA